MPKFYPDNDCDFYVERLIDHFHSPRLHVLRRNPEKNPVRWFRDQDNPEQSFICSWGIEKPFMKNTGLKCDKFIKSRLRKNVELPAAGRRGLWKISRVDPCRFGKLQPHKWSLETWLNESSFRKHQKEDK